MKKTKLVIGIAGNIGSGKGTIANYLVDKYKVQNLRYSSILQDILFRLHLSFNRKNLATLGEVLRDVYGKDILSKVLFKDIKKSNGDIFVVEGIRKKEELDYFRKNEDFIFLFIDVEIKIRHQRVSSRNEKTDDCGKSFEEFMADHKRAADLDMDKLKGDADFIIDNNGTLDETMAQIDVIMKNKLRS